MALWTAAILAALGLAWLVGFAVLAYRQARAAAAAYGLVPHITAEEAVGRLGGPRGALPRLRLLLRLPERLLPAAERHAATYLLSLCGPDAVPELVRLLGHPDLTTRHTAEEALRDMNARGSSPEEARALARALAAAVPALEQLLQAPEAQIRFEAAVALQRIRGEKPPTAIRPTHTQLDQDQFR
jgi:HEAT repeat protein